MRSGHGDSRQFGEDGPSRVSRQLVRRSSGQTTDEHHAVENGTSNAGAKAPNEL